MVEQRRNGRSSAAAENRPAPVLQLRPGGGPMGVLKPRPSMSTAYHAVRYMVSQKSLEKMASEKFLRPVHSAPAMIL